MQKGIPQAAAPIPKNGVSICQKLPLISNPTNHIFSLQPAQSYQLAKVIYTGKIKEGMNDGKFNMIPLHALSLIHI